MQNQPPPGQMSGFSYLKSEFSCMSVRFSPFDPNRIAISCCDNFGIVGKGKLLICDMMVGGHMKILKVFEEHDAIFDCCWTEFNPDLILSACGDGEVKLWEVQSGKVHFERHEHKGEIQSIECSHINSNLFLTSGMDGTSRIWDINLQKQINVFQTHKGCAYQAVWHPINPTLFSTVGSDGALRLWDLTSSNKNIASIKAHQGEILSCDFNKYEEQIATSSTDKNINIWDLRNLKVPINVLLGHRYPVRKVKYSPHEQNVLASASYDMSVILWDSLNIQGPLIKMHSSHTEFVVGLDFSIHQPKQIASASWDGKVYAWNWDDKQPQIS